MESATLIEMSEGNLLEADVDALVNTVNTVGIMGKGIALQFKRAYPAMFKDYASAAKAQRLHLGEMHVWPTQELSGPRFIINFPTKGHWRSNSRLQDIEAGLDDLVRVIKDEGITSIAVPPLGCGHGGLDWDIVRPLIVRKLEAVPELRVELFPPQGAPAAASMINNERALAMTPGRAVMVAALDRYTRLVGEGATLIAVQKLLYFLQVAGEPVRLRFEPHHYGPYADQLRPMLRESEGQFTEGFGDGSKKIEFAEPIRVLPAGISAADDVLEPDTRRRLDLLMDLVSDFESSYGLELLATTHWVATHPNASADASDDQIVSAVRSWSPRKERLFSDAHVRTALAALRSRGWLRSSPVLI